MASTETPIDAEVVDEPGSELAVTNHAALTVTTPVNAGDLVERLSTIREAMTDAMKENVDYGVIPGTGSKPTLLKPGAEKLGVLFQLDVQIVNEQHFIGDHLTVSSRATVYHAPSGARLGYGEGMCSTRERKYAYRKQERVCPECGKPAVIKGKKEYGGGWLCFKKKDGCGAKWPDGADVIESQETGDIENPDLPDLWNTVIKMAEKRARVDAILAVTGASALFTQDVEDAAVATAETVPAAGPPYGKPAETAQVEFTRNAIAYLLNPDGADRKEGILPASNAVGLILNQIEQAADGYLPHFALASITRVAVAVKPRRAQATPGESDPAGETDEERAERILEENA